MHQHTENIPAKYKYIYTLLKHFTTSNYTANVLRQKLEQKKKFNLISNSECHKVTLVLNKSFALLKFSIILLCMKYYNIYIFIIIIIYIFILSIYAWLNVSTFLNYSISFFKNTMNRNSCGDSVKIWAKGAKCIIKQCKIWSNTQAYNVCHVSFKQDDYLSTINIETNYNSVVFYS